MNFDLPRLTLADAFGGLLDIAADSGLDKIELQSPHQFGVARHFTAVGNRMRAAMSAAEHEQASRPQKTADRAK
jgi:hypothetical protein